MATIPERVRAVETWQSEHEKACAARWGLLLKVIGWGGGLAASAVLGVAAWGLNTIHEGQQQQIQMLQQIQREAAKPPA